MENEKLRERLKSYFDVMIRLEYLGIHIEGTRDEQYGISPKTIYYYSVPESSTIETEDEEFNKRIKTSDDLMKFGKEMILEMIYDSCEKAYGEEDKWLLDELKKDPSEFFKFRAKVRKGEIWNEELGKLRIKELSEQIEKPSEYKEI